MPPKTTLWPLDGHTIGKHMVLRSYMDAWLPIILSRFERATFVDAFAGPGEYREGEPGSPLIALNALARHTSQSIMTGQIDYVFIEERVDRFVHLKQVLERQRVNGSIPSICRIDTFNGTFAEELTDLITSIRLRNSPAFVMIDPFGVSGVAMDHIKDLMSCPSTEVYVSLMYRDINRFATEPGFENHLDVLFGCTDWRNSRSINGTMERRNFFYDLYERQLRLSGAKYILPFELYGKQGLIYTLFFATQSDLGCDKMKRAMWDVAPLGNFRFKGGTKGQLILGPGIVDLSPPKDDLINAFGLNRWVYIGDIERFMRSDKTLFHTGHHKTHLAEMEREGAIEVRTESRKMRFRFPDGTCLKFVEPPPPEPIQGTLTLQ